MMSTVETTIDQVRAPEAHPAFTWLDLDPVKIKLMDAEEGQGWDRDYVDKVEVLYRAFLYISDSYPQTAVVPSRPVDKFWHQHILDTSKYAADCDQMFGKFMHHFPYFGMRGEEDKKNMSDSYDETLSLYRRHFGQSVLDVLNEVTGSPVDCSSCGANSCGNCRGNCVGTSCSGSKVALVNPTVRPTLG